MPFVRSCHGCPAEFDTLDEIGDHLRVDHPGRAGHEFSTRFVPIYDALHGEPTPRRDIYCSRCGTRSNRDESTKKWFHDDGTPICVDPESSAAR